MKNQYYISQFIMEKEYLKHYTLYETETPVEAVRNWFSLEGVDLDSGDSYSVYIDSYNWDLYVGVFDRDLNLLETYHIYGEEMPPYFDKVDNNCFWECNS